MSQKLAVASFGLSIALAGAAGWAFQDIRKLERKISVLEQAPDPKAIPDSSRPAADDPRAALASHLEALERRLDQADADFQFGSRTFKEEADKSSEEIDAQATEIMGKLAEIRKNPPQELTDAILEEQVRAGLMEKRKKDMKKLVKTQGQKNLKAAREKMNLSEAQVEELKKYFEGLYEEWSTTLAQIFAGEEVAPAELDAKVADTKKRTDTKMKEVLQPEQYDTWKKDVEPTFYQDPFRGGGR